MKKILIIFGGKSQEHDISIKSVNYIIKNIKYNNYSLVGIDKQGNWFEVKRKLLNKNWKNNIIKKIYNIPKYLEEYDKVFPLIHGNTGEDGKIQSMLELFNIKYIGTNSINSLICYDKLLTKLILEKYSIPQVEYYTYNKELNFNTIKYPVIVKPSKSGSSIGISIATSKKELINSIKLAKKYDTNIVIEKFIENKRELECAIIEDNNKIIISNIGEIVNTSFYDYNSKYNIYNNTKISDIDANIKNNIKSYSKKIFKILNCKKLARIDFLYDINNNKLYFNEINTIPGLTETSMYPKLLNNINYSNNEIINILLDI